MVVRLFYKEGENFGSTEGSAMNSTAFREGRGAAGFTFIETLVVVGIIGIFMIVAYPSIVNTMAVRDLENVTRQVQTSLQMTKNQAISSKIPHRVRFYQPEGSYWAYDMERLEADGTWAKAQPNVPPRTIPPRFNVTIALPAAGVGYQAVFSPLGLFPEFTAAQNSIVLQSPKLDRPNVMDERVLSIFMGGSIHYDRRKSS